MDTIGINAKIKHTRRINNNDRFFIVTVNLDGGYGDIGWIEKDFIENDFINSVNGMGLSCISITNVREFATITDYEKYKLNNGML